LAHTPQSDRFLLKLKVTYATLAKEGDIAAFLKAARPLAILLFAFIFVFD